MSIRQCTDVLGPNWAEEHYDGGRGLHRFYEALSETELLVADAYFRGGRLVRWGGQVDEVAALVAAARSRRS